MTFVLCLSLLLLQAPVSAPIRPDPVLTPGDTMPITRDQMCLTPGYTDTVRHVTSKDKRAIFERYGLAPSKNYEIDHLVPLVMGGSNSHDNLWPQSYLTTPLNARVKDALENQLRRQVCWGTLPLAEAQAALRTDWVKAYKRFVK